MGVSIRLDGDTSKLISKLKKLSEIDKKGVNLALAEGVRAGTKERFREQKAPDGKKWKKSIRAAQEGGVTLTKSAGLKNSIKSTATSAGFAVGTNKIYAATHQLGEKGRKVTIRAKTQKGLVFKIGGKWVRKHQVSVNIKIPARPFLGISEDDRKDIKATMERMMLEE